MTALSAQELLHTVRNITQKFSIPEYERSYPESPNEVRLKEFDFGIYELVPRLTTSSNFELDIGDMDDL